jgi:hypothetical protein
MNINRRIQRLNETVAKSVVSASRVPTYHQALALAIQSAVASRPTSIRIILNIAQRGFQVSDNGVDCVIDDDGLVHLGNVSQLTITRKMPGSGIVKLRKISFGNVIETSIDSRNSHIIGTQLESYNLFLQIPVRRKVMEAELAQTSKLYASVRRVVQQAALIRPEIWWHVGDKSNNNCILSICRSQGDLLHSFLNAFAPVSFPPVAIKVKEIGISIEGLIWSWTEQIGLRIQWLFAGGHLIQCPDLIHMYELCVLAMRVQTNSNMTATPPLIIGLEYLKSSKFRGTK